MFLILLQKFNFVRSSYVHVTLYGLVIQYETMFIIFRLVVEGKQTFDLSIKTDFVGHEHKLTIF